MHNILKHHIKNGSTKIETVVIKIFRRLRPLAPNPPPTAMVAPTVGVFILSGWDPIAILCLFMRNYKRWACRECYKNVRVLG
jgi:hypothetical protein